MPTTSEELDKLRARHFNGLVEQPAVVGGKRGFEPVTNGYVEQPAIVDGKVFEPTTRHVDHSIIPAQKGFEPATSTDLIDVSEAELLTSLRTSLTEIEHHSRYFLN